MKRCVLKHRIARSDEVYSVVELVLPTGSYFRKAGVQGDTMWLWVESDEAPVETFRVHVLATGETIRSPDMEFIETVLWGAHVWHVYVERP